MKLPSINTKPWGEIGLEEILAAGAAQGPYPLVALGDVEVASFGAGRFETSDLSWQEDLDLLGTHADFVLVVPAPTEGTSV